MVLTRAAAPLAYFYAGVLVFRVAAAVMIADFRSWFDLFYLAMLVVLAVHASWKYTPRHYFNIVVSYLMFSAMAIGDMFMWAGLPRLYTLPEFLEAVPALIPAASIDTRLIRHVSGLVFAVGVMIPAIVTMRRGEAEASGLISRGDNATDVLVVDDGILDEVPKK